MKKTNVKVVSKMKAMLKRNPCISLKKGSTTDEYSKNYIPSNNYEELGVENLQTNRK
jgi:hypothetical protein